MAKDKLQPKQIYTKEKAQHLVRVYMSVLCAVSLIGWLNIFIVNPLRTDAKEMVRHCCHLLWKLSNTPLTCCVPMVVIFYFSGTHGS